MCHLLSKRLRFKHFDARTVRQQLPLKVGGGTQVECKVGILVGAGYLALRVVQRQRAQVVGRRVVGTDDDVSHRHRYGQHTEVFGKVSLRRETPGHGERLGGQLCLRQAVQRVDAHLVVGSTRQQVPPLVKQLQRIRAHHFLVALHPELLVAYKQAVVALDGTHYQRQILHAGRHVLQYHTVFHGHTVRQHAVHRYRREQPRHQSVVLQHTGVADIIAVGLFLTADNHPEEVQYHVAVPVERGARQRVAVGHAVVHPLAAQLAQRQFPVESQRVDYPNILSE